MNLDFKCLSSPTSTNTACLLVDVVHEVGHRGVVEHQRGGELEALEGGLQPVAELHARQGVEAHLHQGRGEVEVAGAFQDVLLRKQE